jgi:hypothetical protein
MFMLHHIRNTIYSLCPYLFERIEYKFTTGVPGPGIEADVKAAIHDVSILPAPDRNLAHAARHYRTFG